MNSDRFDVAVVGAGSAGATAAAFLAMRNLRVALVDASTFESPHLQAAWLSAKAIPFLSELKINTDKVLSDPINELTFHNADFSKSSHTQFGEPAGFLVNRSMLDASLRQAATKSGAVLMVGAPATGVRLNESDLELNLKDGKRLTSRLLIVATGRDLALPTHVGFRSEPGSSGLWTAQVDAVVKTPRAKRPEISVVLGLDGGSGFSWCGKWNDRVVVNVNLSKDRDHVIDHLQSICRLGFQHGLLPADLSESAAKVKSHRSTAGGALDMETHVAKHSLLIGEAGGFISAANNDGLFPAMWSAKLAAETIEEALRSKFSQDALMSFDSKWRTQMADYLRSPHTDIRFLLPLIFSNQPMADRMGAAFLLGSNI